MKKHFLTIFITLFVVCSVFSGEKSRWGWTPNSEPDMSHYIIKMWVGSDTNLTEFTYVPFDSVLHDSVNMIDDTTLVSMYFEWDNSNPFIKGAISAVDSAGNMSEFAFSKFYHISEFDTTAPKSVAGFGIGD